MKLFEDEKLIIESSNKQIKLTDQRLRYYEKSDFISIMLNKVSSVELTYYKSSIWILIIGIVSAPVIVGFILIYIYFISKRHVVSVTPDGGRPIIFATKGLKREFLEEFIYEIELRAKQTHLN